MRRSHVRRWFHQQDHARAVRKHERHQDNALRRMAIALQGGTFAVIGRIMADQMDKDAEALLAGFSNSVGTTLVWGGPEHIAAMRQLRRECTGELVTPFSESLGKMGEAFHRVADDVEALAKVLK